LTHRELFKQQNSAVPTSQFRAIAQPSFSLAVDNSHQRSERSQSDAVIDRARQRSEFEITKIGDRLILQPVRPSWLSFATCERASDDFMIDREEIIVDEERVPFD